MFGGWKCFANFAMLLESAKVLTRKIKGCGPGLGEALYKRTQAPEHLISSNSSHLVLNGLLLKLQSLVKMLKSKPSLGTLHY